MKDSRADPYGIDYVVTHLNHEMQRKLCVGLYRGCIFVFFTAITASLNQNQNGLKPVITVQSIQVI